jgi:hypothetical protein
LHRYLLLETTPKAGTLRRRYISSDRQSLLGSHQRSWWFNEINQELLLISPLEVLQ